jgi:hypothetical protein
VINPHYRFPNVGSDVNKQGVFEETFLVESGVSQIITASEIINGNFLPTTPKRTFGEGFGDYDILKDHWKK